MEFCIDAEQLRKALAEIEIAEQNGFMYCLAVFWMSQAGRTLNRCIAKYSDLLERASPTDGHLDWGRGQEVTQTHKFINGRLIPIEYPKPK